MLNNELKQRLSKVYSLVNQGATEGEKQAAKKALDRMLEKYNLQGIDLNSLDKELYTFKYSTWLDEQLFVRILKVFINENAVKDASKDTWHCREISIQLTYLDFITVSSSYEYFRRHMKSQWNKVCAPAIKRCRSTKTKNAKREELQQAFLSKYVIESKLYKEHELSQVNVYDMSEKERQTRRMMLDVEGGAYKKQVVGGLFLES